MHTHIPCPICGSIKTKICDNFLPTFFCDDCDAVITFKKKVNETFWYVSSKELALRILKAKQPE
jgi:hypothetical protein